MSFYYRLPTVEKCLDKSLKVQPPMHMEPLQAHLVSNSVNSMDEENETSVIEDEVQQEEGDMLENNIQD